MKGKFFLDTNIFVYSFDEKNKKKRQKAGQLIGEALDSQNGLISLQVVQEFLNVSLSKFSTPLKAEDARTYLHKVLNPLCQVFPTIELLEKGIQVRSRY